MQIHSIKSFPGRNIYSHKPVVRMTLDIGEFGDKPTNLLEGFNEKLLGTFPGLKSHHCALRYEGGFVERLITGTYLGHVIEHLAIELQNIMGYEVHYGKTRQLEEPSLYYIVMEYRNESCAFECARAAVNIAEGFAKNELPDIEAILKNIRKVADESDLGPSTRAIFDQAVKRGIPVRRVGNESLLQLGLGKYARFIEASLTDGPSCISVDMASNKHLTKQMLSDSRIPTPEGGYAYTFYSALDLAEHIGYPVVVKPLNSSQGKGVSLNIRNSRQLELAYNEAVKHSRTVIVEKYITGKDYRVLVVGGRVSAVSERRPACVTGDGVHNIEQLIEIENTNPMRGEDHEKPLTKIKLDDTVKSLLASNGMGVDYVPGKGEDVFLRDNANLSTGGSAIDCTDKIHPHNAELAIKAVEVLGLDVAGVDITMQDISLPLNPSNGAVIEVNAAPGLRMHLFPGYGQARNVAADIVDMMFPDGAPSSIPIISITGTNGKTTTTRLIAHTLSMGGMRIGMTSTSGIYVGGRCILKGDNTGPVSAGIVLSNKEVECAVLETARGGLIRGGLGYDLADVGVIVNIDEDHLGMDGIETLEDLAHIKSLVIEAVKPEGYAVLNADDRMLDYLVKRVRSRLMLFSCHEDNPAVLEHMQAGGKAVFIKNGNIVFYDGSKAKSVIGIDDIPITFGGMLDCNIENSLAAVSALCSLDVNFNMVRQGLMSFKPDLSTNPGRFNIFEVGDFKVMLDYSHNTPGYAAVAKLLQDTGAKRFVGVVGMPGDRQDKSIYEVGKLCAKMFNRLYIKEDNDLRGRDAGEVADILYSAAVTAGMPKENIEIVYSELKALETAMLDARAGDFIVMFYEEFEPAVELVRKFAEEAGKSCGQRLKIAGNAG